jgi:glycosyltransferase involved in cell wall biosynthesis
MRSVLYSEDYLPAVGGIAAHVHELAVAFRNLGEDVPVVTTSVGSWKTVSSWRWRSVVRDEVVALELPAIRLPGGRRFRWESRWRGAVNGFLRSQRPLDCPLLLHVHWGSAAWFKHDCIRIFTNHSSKFLQDMENGRPESWARNFQQYHWIITPSQELADRTVEAGFPREQVSYIPNGVDTSRFRPDAALRAEMRRKLGVAESDVLILCARRLTPKNGVIDFAHSLRFLDSRCRNVVIAVAGNSNEAHNHYENETLAAFRLCSAGRQARLLGKIPNSDMHQVYVAADISVLPSLKEATSITGLESMACGVPIVGTRVGGIPDLVQHERTGLLVERGDPRAIAAALSRLIIAEEFRRELGSRARERAVQLFDWKSIAKRTREVYENASQVEVPNKMGRRLL